MLLLKKARENFLAAKMIMRQHPNAAATRLYYAAYQCMVYDLETRFSTLPRSIQARVNERRASDINPWPHPMACEQYVLHNRSAVTEAEETALRELRTCREKADYHPIVSVVADDVEVLMQELFDFFTSNGVPQCIQRT